MYVYMIRKSDKEVFLFTFTYRVSSCHQMDVLVYFNKTSVIICVFIQVLKRAITLVLVSLNHFLSDYPKVLKHVFWWFKSYHKIIQSHVCARVYIYIHIYSIRPLLKTMHLKSLKKFLFFKTFSPFPVCVKKT